MSRKNVNVVLHGFKKGEPKFFFLCAFWQANEKEIVDFIHDTAKNVSDLYIKLSEVQK